MTVISLVSLQAMSVKFAWNLLNCVRRVAPGDQQYIMFRRSLKEKEVKYVNYYSLVDGLFSFKSWLGISNACGLRQKILDAEDYSKVIGHFGQDKILELVTWNFHSPKLGEEIRDYESGCLVCQAKKVSQRRRNSTLESLKPVWSPWLSISIDLITELPESLGFTQIWLVVERFSKMAHFIRLRKNAKPTDLANVFFREVWKLYELTLDIVSDRVAKLTSNLWEVLMVRLEVKRRMSIVYLP